MSATEDSFENGNTLKRLARSSLAPPSLNEIVPARIAIIEPNGSKAELLHYFCSHYWGFRVVVLEKMARKGIIAVHRTRPELVLATVAPADLDLSSFMLELRKVASASKVVLMAARCDEYLLHAIESTGYHGLVYEPDEDLRSLGRAIDQVRRGLRFTSRRMVECQEKLRTNSAAFSKLLTKREQEVLVCISHSLSDEEIAARLGCRSGTVMTHRRELMRKLDVHSTPKLIRYGIDKGFDSASLPDFAARIPRGSA